MSETHLRELGQARWRAWASLAWERAWPLLLPAVSVVALFLAASWIGLWPMVSDAVRYLLLAGFATAFAASLWPLRKLSLPADSQADTRIERVSALPHRPVTAQQDVRSGVTGSRDRFAEALWKEHQRRATEQLKSLRAGVPVPKIAERDPYGLRAVVPMLLFVGLMAGWGNLGTRIGDAFRSHVVPAAIAEGRIDAWVKPPAYTNRPPIFLTKADTEPRDSWNVPEGSEVVVRVLDLEEPSLATIADGLERAIDPAEGAAEDGQPKKAGVSYTLKLEGDAAVELRSGDSTARRWAFSIIPDEDPTIAFTEEPKGSNRGALEFAYAVTDDYGVISGRAEIRSAKAGSSDAKPLVEAPDVKLPLPRRRAREGTSKTSRDLTAHPWAGAEVTIDLVVEDDAGQTGRSGPVTFTLPQRVFTRPLALAIVEERRNLALDQRNRKQVAEMLDVITTTHPETFITDKSVYTSLRVAYRMIARSDDPAVLKDALELLWETALSVEDGDLSAAERRLRDAQERLSEALENGASEEEIERLMEELRQAMNEFMRELAEQMAKNPQQQAMPLDENTQILRQQDLERMMQRIEDLAKSGSRDAARELLQELQRMMNNLQTARPGQQQQGQDEFSQQMNRLGEMMRQQQQLMDRTFDMQRRQQQQGQQQQGQQNGQQQQQGRRPGQQGQQGQQGGEQQQGQQGQGQGQQPMTPEEFAEALRQLQEQQGDLQQQMQELQDAMRGMGMDPGRLGEAGEAMGEAEGELGQGRPGDATGQQGRALQAMRDGAQQMMQQMQNMARQQGQQPGQGQGNERGGPDGQMRADRDPLGRQSRTRGPQLGNETKVPGEIDAQRAREILDAIRRRLSEPSRPALELDYLDRLLPSR